MYTIFGIEIWSRWFVLMTFIIWIGFIPLILGIINAVDKDFYRLYLHNDQGESRAVMTVFWPLTLTIVLPIILIYKLGFWTTKAIGYIINRISFVFRLMFYGAKAFKEEQK